MKNYSQTATATYWREYRANGAKRKMNYKPITRGMLDLNGITIENYEGEWIIQKDGKVQTLVMKVGKPGPKYPNGKRTLWLNLWGYRTEDATEKTEFVLSLQAVLYAYFIGTVHENYVVHHIDDNPLNNDLSNLILVTRSEHSKLHKDDRKKYKKVRSVE